MISDETREKWKSELAYIQTYGLDYLNEWETEFLDSVIELLEFDEDLSFAQSKVLRRIFDKIQREVE